jgi:hypothetical protein
MAEIASLSEKMSNAPGYIGLEWLKSNTWKKMFGD